MVRTARARSSCCATQWYLIHPICSENKPLLLLQASFQKAQCATSLRANCQVVM